MLVFAVAWHCCVSVLRPFSLARKRKRIDHQKSLLPLTHKSLSRLPDAWDVSLLIVSVLYFRYESVCGPCGSVVTSL